MVPAETVGAHALELPVVGRERGLVQPDETHNALAWDQPDVSKHVAHDREEL